MNREELIKTCHKILKEICGKYGYEYLVENEDRQKGLYGESFTKVLESDFGECTKGYLVYKNENDKSSYFSFRFRFANPCISFNSYEERDGRPVESFAEIEFHTTTCVPSGKFYEKDTRFFKKGAPIYEIITIPAEISQVMLRNPNVSTKYYLEMKELFEKYNSEN